MKYGQLIKYNTRNIFLEKSYIKCGGETISRPLSKKKKKNPAYLGISSLKFYTVCFSCISRWWSPKYIEIKLQNTCFYLT